MDRNCMDLRSFRLDLRLFLVYKISVFFLLRPLALIPSGLSPHTATRSTPARAGRALDGRPGPRSAFRDLISVVGPNS